MGQAAVLERSARVSRPLRPHSPPTHRLGAVPALLLLPALAALDLWGRDQGCGGKGWRAGWQRAVAPRDGSSPQSSAAAQQHQPAKAHHVGVLGEVVLAKGVGAPLTAEQHPSHRLPGGARAAGGYVGARGGVARREGAGTRRGRRGKRSRVPMGPDRDRPHLRLALAHGARVVGAGPGGRRVQLSLAQPQAVSVVDGRAAAGGGGGQAVVVGGRQATQAGHTGRPCRHATRRHGGTRSYGAQVPRHWLPPPHQLSHSMSSPPSQQIWQKSCKGRKEEGRPAGGGEDGARRAQGGQRSYSPARG